MVGKAHLVASVLSINHPVTVEVKQVGVAVPIIRLPSPVCLLVADQLPCVLCHKVIPPDILLYEQQGLNHQMLKVLFGKCHVSCAMFHVV